LNSDKLSPEELAELDSAFRDQFLHLDDEDFANVDPVTYSHGDGDTCLHRACHRGNLRLVKMLLRAGADLNARGDMGYTPLHYAATPEIVEVLLAAGADISLRNEFGTAPIGWQK